MEVDGEWLVLQQADVGWGSFFRYDSDRPNQKRGEAGGGARRQTFFSDSAGGHGRGAEQIVQEKRPDLLERGEREREMKGTNCFFPLSPWHTISFLEARRQNHQNRGK